jgi:hypothetical protein
LVYSDLLLIQTILRRLASAMPDETINRRNRKSPNRLNPLNLPGAAQLRRQKLALLWRPADPSACDSFKFKPDRRRCLWHPFWRIGDSQVHLGYTTSGVIMQLVTLLTCGFLEIEERLGSQINFFVSGTRCRQKSD